VVAHHPDELGIQLGGERFNEASKLSVCLRLARIGQIAGENDRVGAQAGVCQLLEQLAKPAIGIYRPVERGVAPDEMRIADV